MKRHAAVFCLCLILIPSAAFAQGSAIEAGGLLIDGQATVTSTGYEDEDERTTQILLNPGIQYFVIPGLAVGGEVILTHASFDSESISSYGIGPAVSFYFGRGERTFHPYLSASAIIVRNSNSFDDETNTSTALRGAGGVLVMLSESVGLTTELFYADNSSDNLDTNSFGLAVGIAAFLLGD